MKFAVVNLGCKVNRVESDAFAAQLLAAGGKAADEREADLVIINTCTVTGEAEKKTRKAVRHALRANGHARVLVTGCAAAIDPAAYEALDVRVQVVAKAGLERVLEACLREAAAMAPRVGGKASPAPASAISATLLRTGAGFPTRVGVKVQDGCDNACTYCIVHVARGRATSRPADEVVAECVAHARAGVREIVLTGINLGSWREKWSASAPCGEASYEAPRAQLIAGMREARLRQRGQEACDGGAANLPEPHAAGLPDLLRRLLRETADLHGEGQPPCRFRISSIEPRDVDDALVDVLAHSEGRVCRHLHLPLQAGSDRVLREMARPYGAADYVALVDRLRAACPELSLSTDVIVGFPGETDADFRETLAMARRCAFSKMHVFPYSRRAGTPAAARADQVPPDVKAARARELRALAAELRAADYARRAGTTEWALVEESGTAMTESYHEVHAPASLAPGTLVATRLPLTLLPSRNAARKGGA